ncbi:HAD family hydrolase [Bacteroidota bacterium]
MINIPSNIKNIIFDLGGVILDIDINSTYEAFLKIGLKKIRNNEMDNDFKSFIFAFEEGRIKKEEFLSKMSFFINNNTNSEDIYKAWNMMLLQFPNKKIEFLKQIKPLYRTFLLSNTNIIHAEYYNNMLKNKHDINNLTDLFEKVYYSHEIGIRKPDPKAFNIVMDENNLKPKETLFVDDMKENIIAAENLGIKGLLYIN